MPDLQQILIDTHSEDIGVRSRAIRALATNGYSEQQATARLIELLASDNAAIIDLAMIGLHRTDNAAVEPLVEIVESGQGCVRVSALCVLGQIGKPFDSILEMLSRAIDDPDPNVRMQAARSVVGMCRDSIDAGRHWRHSTLLLQVRSLLEDSRTNAATNHHWATSRLCLRGLDALGMC